MEIIIDKRLTINQLAHIFSATYPFLKIQIYHYGEEMSHDSFHRLHEISNMKNPQNFTILPEMTICKIEQFFWEQLGLQIAVFRKEGNSWINTAFTNNWTLEQQNKITEKNLGVTA